MLLQFSFQWLRSLFVPPIIIFLVLMLGSILGSFGIAYFTFTSHIRGDLLWFENQYVELEFPRNWYGDSGEYLNSTFGNTFSAIFVAPNVFLYIGLTIYDEKAAQTYIQMYNFSDAYSVVKFQVNKTYSIVLQTNSNVTLVPIKNGTIPVSGYNADYSICLFENGYTENNVQKNVKFMMISYFDKQHMVQISFWGDEDEFDRSYSLFETFLYQMKVKT